MLVVQYIFTWLCDNKSRKTYEIKECVLFHLWIFEEEDETDCPRKGLIQYFYGCKCRHGPDKMVSQNIVRTHLSVRFCLEYRENEDLVTIYILPFILWLKQYVFDF